MKYVKIQIIIALMLMSATASAQFSQLDGGNEFMLKIEGGYMPFIGNVGDNPEEYPLAQFHNAANLNVMLGSNISQDWFVGGGAGFLYYHNTMQGLAEPEMGVSVFADFDFRPIWQGIMGVDYQPVTIKWAPEVGGRVGVSTLLSDVGQISPMGEVYGGLNWYYRHGLRQMEHNWHAFYVTVGVALLHKSLFVPIRLGWRW